MAQMTIELLSNDFCNIDVVLESEKGGKEMQLLFRNGKALL